MAGFGRGPRLVNGKKEKTDIKSLKKLMVFGKQYLPAIIVSILLALVGAATTLYGPTKAEELINIMSAGLKTPEGINLQVFGTGCIVILCVFAGGAIINYLQQFIMAGVTQKLSKKLRTSINNKINKLPLGIVDKTTRGDILSRMTNDVDTISHNISSATSSLVNAGALFIGTLVMMFVVNWILALVTIAFSIIGFVLMIVISKYSQKYFNERQQNLGDMNGHIEEIYTNHNIVKSFNAEDNAREKFSNINKKLFINNWKSQSLSGLMPPIMNFAGNLSYVAIFVVGVALALGGSSSVGFGTIMAFTMYARLFSRPLSDFAQSVAAIQQTSAASRRVFKMLDAPEVENEDHKTLTLTEVKGDVEFKNVKFGYDKDKLVIKDFSAKLNSGQKVAIVGPTGAGKTTLVNLLMRFYEVDEGDILIDGVSIKDLTRENVRDLFDMILQDTWLFTGTIRENLVYNKTGVTDQQLNEVCNAVGLKHFISTLKDGYDTMLDDKITLSEGQKQQLTIARAMIKDSPLLILDEATSSVDTRTELIIQNAMDNLTKGRTSFVIAHRLSTIKMPMLF